MTVDEILQEVASPNPRPEAVRACAQELRATRKRLAELAQPDSSLSPETVQQGLRDVLATPNALDCTTLEPRRSAALARPGIGDVVVKK